MSETDDAVPSGEAEQKPTVRQLSAGEWVEVLRDTDYTLRFSDGTREGTIYFWMEGGWLHARRLIWYKDRQVGNHELTAELEDDEMTSQLVVRDD